MSQRDLNFNPNKNALSSPIRKAHQYGYEEDRIHQMGNNDMMNTSGISNYSHNKSVKQLHKP